MNKHLSIALDNIGIRQKLKNRSSESQFRKPINTYIDLNEFYLKPVVPDIKYSNLESLHFEFQTNINFIDDNISKGICYLNKRSLNNIVFVHGWQSTKLSNSIGVFLDEFISQNYNVYFLMLPYHFDRKPENSFAGEYTISSNINRTLNCIRQAVYETRALVEFIKTGNQQSRIALVGFSLGGLITNLVSTLQNNIDCLVSLMYVNSLTNLVWKSDLCKFIKQDLEDHGINFTTLKSFWNILEPGNLIPNLSPDKMLLMYGKFDKFVLDSNTLYDEWGIENNIKPYPFGHSGIRFCKERIRKDTVNFITNFLK